MARPMPGCMMPDGGECCPEYAGLLQENAQLRAALQSMVEAYDAHQIEMNSPDISQDVGQGVHPWHEEWFHHARAALKVD